MKKKIVLLGFLIITYFSNAQETTLDKISKETCEYLSSIDLKKLSSGDRNAELGFYIIKLYNKYESALKKEGIVMDLSKGKQGGAAFGEKVGMNMIKFCPDVLIALASEEGIQDYKEEAPEKSLAVEGKIKKVSGNELYVIEVKETSGMTQKLLWLSNFEGSDQLLALGKKRRGKSVRIFYENIEYFSPKLQEYIIRKKVLKVEFL